MTEPRRFDIRGPLPTGVTVLEASAGTGKTYTLAALAARYVTSGIPLHEILLVTFTRLATGELRERVRERLVEAEFLADRLDHVHASGRTRAHDGRIRRHDLHEEEAEEKNSKQYGYCEEQSLERMTQHDGPSYSAAVASWPSRS